MPFYLLIIFIFYGFYLLSELDYKFYISLLIVTLDLIYKLYKKSLNRIIKLVKALIYID